MRHALVLGQPHQIAREPMEPRERSLRLLVKALAEIGVEITPELIRSLSVVVEHWPRPSDGTSTA